jgi:tetratricopeptide (TPR) repeat protein
VLWGNLGNKYNDIGNVYKAIECYEKALSISQSIGDRQNQHWQLGTLGDMQINLGEFTLAINKHKDALEIAQELGDEFGEAWHRMSLGEAFSFYENYDDALKMLNTAWEIANRLKAQYLISFGGCDLSTVHLLSNNVLDARHFIENAITCNEPRNNHNASALHGIIALRQGDEVTAREAFVRAIGQADEILSKTAEYYSALDAKGIAISGLAICDLPPSGTSRLAGRGDPSMPTGANDGKPAPPDMAMVSAGRVAPTINDAIEIFRKARQIAPHAGVVKSVLRLFDELAKCDTGGVLEPVRAAAAGKE